LIRVVDVDTLDRTVTLGADPQNGVGQVTTDHPFLRRWDQQCRSDSTEPAGLYESRGCTVQFSDADTVWIDLEDGVQVAFEKGILRVGDYWLIPARTETGDVEWPQEAAGPKALPPFGVEYAFAPLAIVRGAGSVDDLRRSFQAYGVSGTPTFVLIDGEGRIASQSTGYTPEKGLPIEGWSWAGRTDGSRIP